MSKKPTIDDAEAVLVDDVEVLKQQGQWDKIQKSLTESELAKINDILTRHGKGE